MEKTEFVHVLAARDGDDLSAGLGAGLEAAFASQPVVDVRPVPASGATAEDSGKLLEGLPTPLPGAGRDDYVVVEARPQWAQLGEDRLAALIEEIGSAVRKRGARLVWVGLAPPPGESVPAGVASLNGALRAAAQKYDSGYVDSAAIFADDQGAFSAFGPSVTGERVRLRQDADGALTRAGARKLAHFVAAEIRRLQSERREPAPRAPAAVDPFSLPGPQLPHESAPQTAARPLPPAIGPVLPLTQTWVEPGGKLLPLKPPQAKAQVNQPQRPTPAGRADDFRWPPAASTGATAPATP